MNGALVFLCFTLRVSSYRKVNYIITVFSYLTPLGLNFTSVFAVGPGLLEGGLHRENVVYSNPHSVHVWTDVRQTRSFRGWISLYHQISVHW